MTTLAFALLLLDGVLMVQAAINLRTSAIAELPRLLILVSIGIGLYYRRYARTMAEVQQAKEALQAELTELRRLVKERDQKR